MRWLSTGSGVLLLLLLLVFALCVAGCARKTAPQPAPYRSAPRRATPASPSAQQLAAAKDAVGRYLNALSQQDFRGAYVLLSAESKRRHPYAEFERDAQAAHVQYDVTSAKAAATGPTEVDVTLSMPSDEDPGEKTFAVVLEEGRWKVQYLGGRPFSPYGE